MEESCESCQAETATQKLVNNQCESIFKETNPYLCCSMLDVVAW